LRQTLPFSSRGGAAAFCQVPDLPTDAHLARAVELGFDAVVLPAKNEAPASEDLKPIIARAASAQLGVILDVPSGQAEAVLTNGCADGIAGFCCRTAHHLPPDTWTRLIASVRQRHPGVFFIAVTHGAGPDAMSRLAPCGFDAAVSSSCWWDFHAGWLDEDTARVAALGTVIALPFPPGDDTDPGVPRKRRAITFAGHYAPLWMVDLDRFVGLEPEIAAINAKRRAEPELFAGFPARLVSPPDAEIAVLARGVSEAPNIVLAINPDTETPATLPASSVLPQIGGAGALASAQDTVEAGETLRLLPAEARVYRFVAAPPILRATQKTAPPPAARTASQRISIEAVTPSVDDGRYPAKRIVGELASIEADLISDGHGALAADVLWRAADDAEWQHAQMAALGNDRFAASFPLTRIGRHVFTVEAWHDPFASLLEDIAKKQAASVSFAVEIEEAVALMRAAKIPAFAEASPAVEPGSPEELLAVITTPDTIATMRSTCREFVSKFASVLSLDVERPAAEFASWYELFPRSQSGDPARHGTFADVTARLPAIRAMGFDVLYFPPIHPIGEVHRKGRNNALVAQPDDPGSPYAIGSAAGGHDAIHPSLGTIEDFRSLRQAAAEQGIEIALDFAIQCAPDHPWVRAHPEWFAWRPDGTIRYAENPPKRYEDIVNVAFHAPDAVPGLWNALRDVVRFWVDQGIRTFRVDNPHTKPLPFWEWLIDDIRAQAPDAIFLAEAFTRPGMMYRLAKLGFSQSYTYFTWRNTKYELTTYFTELSQAPVADYFRPHLFVNTPDINPLFLQQGGRPAFLIRAALAATLSGLWGMYNGFELCEARALPGREEYLDSEKYEIRAWDWDRPGNIVAEIARLNQIRRSNPALQSHRGLEFHNAFDDAVLYYAKTSPDGRNTVLVAVNLDPYHAVEVEVEIPLWRFGLPDHASIGAEDLMREHAFTWYGKRQRIRLDPFDLPFAIWRLSPHAESSK
jgi:starch synthase (maltosyl-transferring)